MLCLCNRETFSAIDTCYMCRVAGPERNKVNPQATERIIRTKDRRAPVTGEALLSQTLANLARLAVDGSTEDIRACASMSHGDLLGFAADSQTLTEVQS